VLNAFAETFYEQALDQARASEARYAGRGRPVRPLDGLPVAVKEEAEIAGQRNTLGSLPRRDVVAEQTTAFVQRIIDAGAIVHARTTPGFCCAPITWSRLWGVTRNPWNTRYSPGGASPDDPALASYWAARREKIKPPLIGTAAAAHRAARAVSLQARQRRNPELQPATPSRLA
jgi:hypothetical protein